jgi:uncharacterized OB-fold protein
MARRPFRQELMTLDPLALVGSRCRNCGATSFPARSTCPSCRSSDRPERANLSTTGVVYTYTVVRQAPPGEEVPYVLAYVDLPEGVRLLTQLQRDCIKDVEIGMKVRLSERPLGTTEDGTELIGYQFVPAD